MRHDILLGVRTRLSRSLVLALIAMLAANMPAVAGVKCSIKGTAGRDTLRGTAKADVICGLGGNDKLLGLTGADILRGGGGNDSLDGGSEADSLIGGAGIDTAIGGSGDDACDAEHRLSSCESLWRATWDGPKHFDDWTSNLAIDPQGERLFISGLTEDTVHSYAKDDEDSDILLLALRTKNGAEDWHVSIDGPIGGRDVAGGVTVSPAGTVVYLSGVESTVSKYDPDRAFIAAFATDTGTLLWRTNLPSATSAGRIVLSTDGQRIFVASRAAGVGHVYALDSDDGDIAWDEAIEEATFAAGMVVLPTGVIVTGPAVAPDGGITPLIVTSLDAVDGSPNWQVPMSITSSWRTMGAAALSPDGSVYALAANIADGHEFYGIDTDDGMVIWDTEWLGSPDGGAALYQEGMRWTPDASRIVVAAMSDSLSNDEDVVTLGLNTLDGTVEWSDRIDDPIGAYNSPSGVLMTPGGDAYVTTLVHHQDLGQEWPLILRVDPATGAIEDEISLEGEDQTAFRLGLSPDGTTLYGAGGRWHNAWTDVRAWAFPIG